MVLRWFRRQVRDPNLRSVGLWLRVFVTENAISRFETSKVPTVKLIARLKRAHGSSSALSKYNKVTRDAVPSLRDP